jgi:hypothetical protein
MKKLIVSLFTVFTVVTAYQSHAQNTPEKDIAILRSSELLDILRLNTDILANVDRFVGEIHKIVPLNQQKSDFLKKEMLAILQKQEGGAENWSLLYWPIDRSPFLGSSIDKLLKDNFSPSDYEKLSDQLSTKLETAVSAYNRLTELHKTRVDAVDFCLNSMARYIQMIYEYFGI